MKPMILGAALAVIGMPASAQVASVDNATSLAEVGHQNGDSVYIDTASIVREGAGVRFRIFTLFAAPQPQPNSRPAAAAYMIKTADCVARTEQLTGYDPFDELSLPLPAVRLRNPTAPVTLTADSLDGKALAIACGESPPASARLSRTAAQIQKANEALQAIRAANAARTAPLDAAAEAAALAAAQARGLLIYKLDQAAWHATDRALERLPRQRRDQVRGYVVELDGEEQVVTFYGKEGDTPHALYVARMNGSRVRNAREIKADEPRTLTPIQLRIMRAREAAVASAQGLSFCTRGNPNALAIPPRTAEEPVDVYLLTSQEQTNVFPFGGHHRMTVAADGSITARRSFTNGCVNMPKPGSVPGAPSGAVAMLGVSHLLDPTPTEIHVWIAHWSATDVLVMLPDSGRAYQVTRTTITPAAMPSGMPRR